MNYKLAALVAAFLLPFIASGADAKPRKRVAAQTEAVFDHATMGMGSASASYTYSGGPRGISGVPATRRDSRSSRHRGVEPFRGTTSSLAGVVSQLQSQCGARVISEHRNTYVAGTRMLSCHASGQAVDMVGPPACIYSVLASYPGGYSIDYARVQHVHISSCAREWGLRFNHGGGGRKKARKHRHR